MRQRDLALATFLVIAAVCAFAQAQPVPLVPQPQTGSPQAVQAQANPPAQTTPNPQAPAVSASVPVFQFRLRAAFMLTPAMVAAIQSTSQRVQDSKAAQQSSADKDGNPAWNDPIVRDVNLAASLGIKIQGDQLIAMIIFMPVELAKKDITLLVQNQVYARSPDNSIQLNTSVHTIRIPLGSVFYYYPLGGDPKQGAPVVIEILVNQK